MMGSDGVRWILVVCNTYLKYITSITYKGVVYKLKLKNIYTFMFCILR